MCSQIATVNKLLQLAGEEINKSEIQLAIYNQMMPRLPGCLFKFIQKQPPDTRGVHSRQLASYYYLTGVRKLKRCSQKFLTKFTRKALALESLFQILLKKRLWHLFSCEFCEISNNTFSTNTYLVLSSELAILRSLGDCCFFLLTLTFLSPLCSQL